MRLPLGEDALHHGRPGLTKRKTAYSGAQVVRASEQMKAQAFCERDSCSCGMATKGNPLRRTSEPLMRFHSSSRDTSPGLLSEDFEP